MDLVIISGSGNFNFLGGPFLIPDQTIISKDRRQKQSYSACNLKMTLNFKMSKYLLFIAKYMSSFGISTSISLCNYKIFKD